MVVSSALGVIKGVGDSTFLFDVLPLPRLRSLGDCLAEERHKLAIATARTTG